LFTLSEQNKKVQNGNNSSYTFPAQAIQKSRMVQLPKPIQSCGKCNVICCRSCEWPANRSLSACVHFACSVCPGRCPREVHVRTTQEIQYYYENLPQEIKSTKDALSIIQSHLQNERQNFKTMAPILLSCIQSVKQLIHNLEQIAYSQKTFTEERYFKDLIDNEQDNKQPGWEMRVESLKAMLDQAIILWKMQQAKDVKDLFPQYRKLIDEYIG